MSKEVVVGEEAMKGYCGDNDCRSYRVDEAGSYCGRAGELGRDYSTSPYAVAERQDCPLLKPRS